MLDRDSILHARFRVPGGQALHPRSGVRMKAALARAQAIARDAAPRVADRIVYHSGAPMILALRHAQDAVMVRRILAARRTNVGPFKPRVTK